MKAIASISLLSMGLLLVPLTALAQSDDLYRTGAAMVALGADAGQPSDLLSPQQLALPYVSDRRPAAVGFSMAALRPGSLKNFQVPRNAPYFANQMIEAAKLGNTRAGIKAMMAASARVTAAAKAAVIADGFGGVTKQTVTDDIEAYFFAIARRNPRAAVELSKAIAPGTRLRAALNPSKAVAASLARMASAARSRMPSRASTMPPLQELYQFSQAVGEHPDVTAGRNKLAALYYAHGRFGYADPIHRLF